MAVAAASQLLSFPSLLQAFQCPAYLVPPARRPPQVSMNPGRNSTEPTDCDRADMAARKEAVMQSVRSEIALANAQELMNVSLMFPSCAHVLLNCTYRRKRMKSASQNVSQNPRLHCRVPKRSVAAFHARALELMHAPHDSRHKTCLARCLDRYMEACGSYCLTRPPNCSLRAITVNVVSKTYIARISKERLEHH